VSDAERDEFEFEPIEDLGDAETPGEEAGETVEPLDDVEFADTEETAEADVAEAFESAGDEGVEQFEPAGEDALPEAAEEEPAFPAEEAMAGAALAAGTGEADEEAVAEEEGEEGEAKPEKKKRKKGGLLAAVRNANPYTIMLIIAFVALLVGTLCLVGELARYDGDIKAEKARRTSALQTVPSPFGDSRPVC